MTVAACPAISVIIPCSRMARFLPDAVGSIRRQAIAADEIVLVDDGTDPDTAPVCAALTAAGAPIRLLRTEPCHPGQARNLGLAAARGTVIAFLDADDLWPADKLALQWDRLARPPKVDMVAGLVTSFDRLDAEQVAPAADARTETMLPLKAGACLFRRPLLEQFGGFDPGLRFAEDFDLMMRLCDAAVPFTILRAVTLYYRQHAAQMTRGPDPRAVSDRRRVLMMTAMRRRRLGLAGDRPLLEDHLEPVA